MSVARSTLCLRLASAQAGARSTTVLAAPASRAALFHTSARLDGKPRRSRFKSVHLDSMGLSNPEKVKQFTEKMYPKYTEAEMQKLSEVYTPEQMEAIKAGEAAIDPEDLTIQARVRNDPYRLPYLDDFSKIMPIIDKRVRPNVPLPDPKARWMGEEETAGDLMKWADGMIPEEYRHLLNNSAQDIDEALKPQIEALERSGKSKGEIEFEKSKLLRSYRNDQQEKYKPLESAMTKSLFDEFPKLIHERSGTTDKNATYSPMAPSLGDRLPSSSAAFVLDPEQEKLDPEDNFDKARRVTGFPLQDIVKIRVKEIISTTVSNQTRLGKIQSWAILSVAGSQDGRVGMGYAKGVDAASTMQKSRMKAIQDLKPIPRYENRTIYGTTSAKLGATIVEIRAQPPGFGLRAPHKLYEVFRLAGLSDISARMPRGRNPINSVKACIMALRNQKDPSQIAVGRGKKMVDVRKVYFANNVQ